MTPWGLPKRYRSKITVNAAGCWLWTGAKQSRGYGCGAGKDGAWLAHRRTYEILTGPIPDGLTLDHLCLVKHCVNPAHLEPVTAAENIRRAADLVELGDHFPCGHPRSTQNTVVKRYANPTRRPNRSCRECGNAATRRWYHAQKEKKAA